MTAIKKLTLILCALIIGFGLTAPVFVHAQQGAAGHVVPGSDGLVPCGSTADNPCQLVDLFNLVIGITNFMISFAGVIAVIAVIFGGYSLVVAAGNPEAVTGAKKLITGAVIGFFFVMAAFAVSNFLIFGSRQIIPGTSFIRGEPVSIIRCPVAYILGQETCGNLPGNNGQSNLNGTGNETVD